MMTSASNRLGALVPSASFSRGALPFDFLVGDEDEVDKLGTGAVVVESSFVGVSCSSEAGLFTAPASSSSAQVLTLAKENREMNNNKLTGVFRILAKILVEIWYLILLAPLAAGLRPGDQRFHGLP